MPKNVFNHYGGIPITPYVFFFFCEIYLNVRQTFHTRTFSLWYKPIHLLQKICGSCVNGECSSLAAMSQLHQHILYYCNSCHLCLIASCSVKLAPPTFSRWMQLLMPDVCLWSLLCFQIRVQWVWKCVSVS